MSNETEKFPKFAENIGNNLCAKKKLYVPLGKTVLPDRTTVSVLPGLSRPKKTHLSFEDRLIVVIIVFGTFTRR